MKYFMRNELGVPAVVDRGTFQAELDALRVREKAHTREGDAIAAARQRLPMVEVDGTTPLIGERGALTLLDAFEAPAAHRVLFMWYTGRPAAGQCEVCTLYTSQVREHCCYPSPQRRASSSSKSRRHWILVAGSKRCASSPPGVQPREARSRKQK